jgi:hypothetical protein
VDKKVNGEVTFLFIITGRYISVSFQGCLLSSKIQLLSRVDRREGRVVVMSSTKARKKEKIYLLRNINSCSLKLTQHSYFLTVPTVEIPQG